MDNVSMPTVRRRLVQENKARFPLKSTSTRLLVFNRRHLADLKTFAEVWGETQIRIQPPEIDGKTQRGNTRGTK